jgi:hypothetical protein
MKNIPCLTFTFVLLAISFLHGVFAVGIGDYTGGLNYVIDFQSGLKRTFSYFIVANAPTVMDYEVIAEGDLAQYFTFSSNIFKDVWPGQTRRFTATLNLPEEKPSPGLHETHVCVTESQSRGGGGIVVRTRACSIINVRVLYSEKYLKIGEFNVPNIDVGDILNINIGVKSWTESDIDTIKAGIDIFGPSEKGFDRKIATLTTDEKPLASNEEAILHASLDTKNLESGEYKAFATVYYDGNEANASTNFRVGILAVKVINYTNKFIRNKVNRFNVDIESRWNSRIEEVYADVKIENETLRTPSIILKPWETATLQTYWDTTNRKAQEYEGKLILHFAGNSTEQDIKVKVLVNPEEIRKLLINVAVTILIVVLIISVVIMALKKQAAKEHGKTKKKK